MSALHSEQDPLHRVLQAFQSAGRKTRKITDGYMISCPGSLHTRGDKDPSLHLSQGHSGAVMKCQAGCDTEDVLAFVGLEMKDLFQQEQRPAAVAPITRKQEKTRVALPFFQTGDACEMSSCAQMSRKSGAECVAQYSYVDKNGKVIGQVHRYQLNDGKKSFRPFTLDEGGAWVMSGTISAPYQLPRALDTLQHGGTVFIVEGEKDVDAINNLGRAGVAATTNSAGAGKWYMEHTSQLLDVGGTISVIGDTDAAGQDHVRKILATFTKLEQEPPRVFYPTQGKDISEHLENSGTLESLREWIPEVQETEHGSKLGRILSRSELENLPPINPLITGWLSIPSAAILVGKYGLGKTAVTMAMACCVATGTKFLGHEVTQARVLYVVGEGVRGIPQRLRAWEKAWGIKVPESELTRPRF